MRAPADIGASPRSHETLSGGGAMGALMRTIDWSQTPIGPVEQWPQSLRTAVSILLESRFPMYIAWGPDFVQLYNDGYRPILGSTKHPAAMGRSSRETFAESWHIIGPMFEGVRRGTAVGSEDWMLPLDRHGFVEECYFTFSYSPIRDESGGVGGVLTTVTETTARVLSERRLSTLRALAEGAASAKREEDAWLEASRALETNGLDLPFALLYRQDEVTGQPRLVATSGFGANAAAAATRFAMKDGAVAWPFIGGIPERTAKLLTDVRAQLVDLPCGQWAELPHSAWLLPIARPGTHQPYGFLVAGLSARREVNDDYRGFCGLVADYLATGISNARAYEEERQRAEALAEVDRAKTAFFSNVSHEFRTPLTLMLGPIEDGLADQKDPLSEGQRERQQLVRRSGLRLQKLVNTLLDFARIEAGRAQAALIPTDLAAFTADLASTFHSAIQSAGLSLTVDCPPLPAAVYVDPAMWEKIVLNLLSNAFKFTFKGEIAVGLRWLGPHVELTVRDTGTGIPAAELPRIFERFHRVEGARGRSHEGTGIGLALVQELLKLHGGTVTAASVPGKGSTFTVSIPTGMAHLAPEQLGLARTLTTTGIASGSFLSEMSQWNGVAAAAPSEVSAVPVERREGRLLVADDNVDMRGYLVKLLSAHWTVDAVSDGAQALAAAQASPPDLVISDVMMPGLDGLQLVRALRADERTRTIPVMLLSARAGEEATIEGLQSGADGYLVKPFSANELLARVDAQLTIAQLRREASRQDKAHAAEATRLLAASRRATLAREETLGVVSHDLRTPLSVIRTATDLLLRLPAEGEAGVRVRKQAEVIQRSAGRMDRLVTDLLDLESIDAGTLAIDLRSHAPAELLREVRELFLAQAEEKSVALTVEAAPGLALECDRGRVLQALSNLTSNALKFTPAGGKVQLRAESGRSTGLVRFSVEDTGKGISPDEQRHVFDRHWQATATRREGHGLGLWITKGIVEGHGGHLGLQSTPGLGSTFWFEMPCDGPRKAEAAQVAPETASETFVQRGGDMGARMRAFDWSKTSLGPLAVWPQSLRTSVSTMLRSPYPIILFWGPERRMLYNDPFRPILGAKHPATLGARGHEALAEEWKLLGPLMQQVLDTGEPLYIENGNVNFERRPGGLREEAYFTWSYNPTIGEDGEIAGLFAIASETTRQVVGDRQLGVLRELSIRAAANKAVDDIFASLEGVLAHAGADLPFALLYVVTGDTAKLVSCNGLERGSRAAPLLQTLAADSPWPLAAVARQQQEVELDELIAKVGPLPGGPWPEPSTRALLLPVPMGAEDQTAVLVAGLSPRRGLDESYRGFLQLLARQLAASIASARAYEQEKHRAEELARLDLAKTAFFSNVSHEFRTPLTLILGPVEDALLRPQRTLEGEKLDLVRRNALRLHKMVNTLLDFSRLEAGRAQATYVPTDLAAFTSHLASAFQSAAESAGLKLLVDCPALPEAIYVDPEMWEKIVLNLLSNAVKYTYAGEIRVQLRWEENEAVFRVEDTGVGIPDDELPRIFERFYRASSIQGRSHEGTGIGLALVQELVKLHGGRVAVQSTLGAGSTFTVRLPQGPSHLPAGRVDRTPRPRSSAVGAAPFVEEALRWSGPDRQPTGEGLASVPVPAAVAQARILLVDDNADLRSYVSGLLAGAFARVETATNGLEALAQALENPPDLILSDVMMPGLDGFGLVRELRAHQKTRGIPIILLTARAGDEAAVEGLSSGADDFLVKPFSARELIARVTTQLEMTRVRREISRHEIVAEQQSATAKARDEWLTVVSHELRTPLSALTLSMQGLIRGSAEAGSVAQKNLARLTRQVEHLVDVAEIVAGGLKLHREEVDISALVTQVIEDAGPRATRAGARIASSASGPLLGRADPARVYELVAGLVDNALKFADGKPMEISVASQNGQAVLCVVDHGPGIPPEDLERIFGRFERAVPTRHFGGLGLGLWMARHIAQAHGGRLAATPTDGGGATFTVFLPLSPGPAAG